MMYVNLPKLMSVNVGRATLHGRCKLKFLDNPAVAQQAVALYLSEIAEDEKAIAKAKGDDKATLEKKLAKKQEDLAEVQKLIPAKGPAKAKKGK
jgi:hypothetical protein